MLENRRVFASENALLRLVGSYTAFTSIVINAISYHYTGNFFSFTEIDARLYDDLGRRLQFDSGGIPYVLTTYSFDDWGAVFLTAFTYYFYESNVALDILYWFMGILTSRYLFRLAKNFMSDDMAAMCTFTFVCSSFTVWFATTGLKESFMLLVIIYSYYAFYRYERTGGVRWILQSMVVLSLLVFFRPVLALLITGSFIFTLSVRRSKSALRLVVVGLIIAGTVVFSSLYELSSSRFLGQRGVVEYMQGQSESEMVRGGLAFTYVVNMLSALMGNFPTLATDSKISHYFASAGLLFKVLLFLPILLSAKQIIGERRFSMFALLLFPLLEIVSLVFILEALELRKSLPHYPMLYILAFAYLSGEIKDTAGSGIRPRMKFIHVSFILFMITIVFWNFR